MSTSSPGGGDICGYEAELSGLSFFILFELAAAVLSKGRNKAEGEKE
jgi:hypothetical protein